MGAASLSVARDRGTSSLLDIATFLAGTSSDDADETLRRVLAQLGHHCRCHAIVIARRDEDRWVTPCHWVSLASETVPLLEALRSALEEAGASEILCQDNTAFDASETRWRLRPIRRTTDAGEEGAAWGVLCLAAPDPHRLDALPAITTLLAAALMRLDDERRLRASFEYRRREADAFFEMAPVGIGIVDRDDRYVRVNAALAAFAGRSVGDHIGKHISEVFAPPQATEILDHLAHVRSHEGGALRRTLSGRAPDGRYTRVAGTYFPIQLAPGGALGVAAVVSEINDRRSDFERALHMVAEASGATSDREFWGTLAREVATITGAHFASICEQDPSDSSRIKTLAFWNHDHLQTDMSFPCEGTPCQVAIREGAAHYPRYLQAHFPDDHWLRDLGVEAYHGFGLRDAAGKTLGIIEVMHNAPLEENDVVPVLSVFAARALAELEHRRASRRSDELEAALHQGQRLQAMGRLAGGVAHDFNNLLTVVTGNSEIALEDLERRRDLTGVSRAVREIRSAADRAARLTRQLLAFSRRQVLRPQTLNVAVILEDMQQMLRRLIGEDIDLRISSASSVRNVRADPGQIEQVILNLVLNARDAMPTGGVLSIEIGEGEIDAAMRALQPDAPDAPCVRITVRDTGIGMKREIADRAFEPFFTTKPVGEGSGLGLATVHGVVSQSGGAVFLDTDLGAGTRVEVFLPIANRECEEPSEKSVRTRKTTGTVLLCEDEESVRRITQRHLERGGYRVLRAGAPQGALALLANHPSVDVLVSDVVMPGMRGPELISEARLLRSELPVLFISGYPRSKVDERIHDPRSAFLPKPFQRQQLLDAVSRLLDPGN